MGRLQQIFRILLCIIGAGLVYSVMDVLHTPRQVYLMEEHLSSTNTNASSLRVFNVTTSPHNNVTVAGLCPLIPPGLTGTFNVSLDVVEWKDLEKYHRELSLGGRWKPKNCIARNRVAILIPYRDRVEHLHIFMANMHAFLQRQQHDYAIYVIEQGGKALFNRGVLFNIGFKEAMKDHDWQCVVLHDVDHIPLNDKNMYSCPKTPRHLSVYVSRKKFRMPYLGYFGGVSMMTTHHYKKINGMSNIYWGWGAEDDDLYLRCKQKSLLPVLRYTKSIARYQTVDKFHFRAPRNPSRGLLLRKARSRMDKEGLNSLKYNVTIKEYRKLFTYILANVTMMQKS